jgi:hypothetical protein
MAVTTVPKAPARRDGTAWLLGLFAGAGVAMLAGQVWPRTTLVHAVTWLVLGFVVLPLGFALALGAVAAVLTALTAPPALLWRLRGRPSGWVALCRELWALPLAIVPRFVAAVAAVRKPMLWGSLLGFVAEVAVVVGWGGWR